MAARRRTRRRTRRRNRRKSRRQRGGGCGCGLSSGGSGQLKGGSKLSVGPLNMKVMPPPRTTQSDIPRPSAKKGGYIRYFNANDELRYGGFLVNIFEDNEITKITLMNTMGKRWVVSWTRNYIFYKKHTTANDKLRKIFISLLE